MELKVTFRFDATETFLASVDKFKEAAVIMVERGILDMLPATDKGRTRALADPSGVRVNRREILLDSRQPEAATESTLEVEGKTEEKKERPSEETKEQENASEAGPAPESGKGETASYRKLSEQDIREAMHRTRQRIEGEDYKNNTDSEGYVKYHKPLTRAFKNLAALLGSDKPSTLPEEQRQAFIDECNLLDVLEDGTIGKPEAF